MEQSPLCVAPSGTKTQWAKPQDWEKYRNTITALFMCHSLPVVMRVMREEHQFHATPKMFQSQIYQKWGLRKTKPGEAKKEAKERKRRRQESEEIESVSSGGRSRETATVDNAGISAGGTKPNSPTAATQNIRPQPTVQEEDDVAASEITDIYTIRSKVGTSTSSVSDLSGTVPKGWQEFLNQSQMYHPPPGDSQDAMSSIISGSQTSSENTRSTEDTGSLASSKTRSVRSSTKSRTSRGTSEERAAFSTPSSAKRARYTAAISKPLGTIRPMDPPLSFLRPEKSMFYARHFISSTFTTGTWALAQNQDTDLFDVECGKLERWYNDFNPGFDCLRRLKVKKAFRLLKRCFANTKAIIEPQDPRVVIYMCQQAIRCMYYDNLGRGLAQTLLKYIAGLCMVLFGPHHPLVIMVTQLSHLNSFEFAQTIRPFMDCYFDHLEPFLEHSTNAFGHITEMRGLTISLMEGTGMMGIYEAKPVLDQLILKAERANLSTLHLKIETAAVLQRNRFFGEALGLLKEVRECDEAGDNPYEMLYAHITLILTLRKMKDLDGAIKSNLELIESLSRPPSTYPGYPDNMSLSLLQYLESRQSSLLLVLGQLEKDLRDTGRIEEADKIQARLDREVTKDYGTEDTTEDPEEVVNAMV